MLRPYWVEKWNNFKIVDYDVLEGTPEKKTREGEKEQKLITLMNDTLVYHTETSLI